MVTLIGRMFLRKSEPVPDRQPFMMRAPKMGMVPKNITYQDVYEAQVIKISSSWYLIAPVVSWLDAVKATA